MASRSLNKVLLIGNLTRNPELKETPNGAKVCTFGLATNSTWKTAEGVVEESTEFHNIVCWNKLAEICEKLLRKGMKVFVEGELRTRSWEDEQDQKRWRTEIKISEMVLLDDKGVQVEEDMDGADMNASNEQIEDVDPEEVLF